jgi:hypothetical protein
MTERGLKSQSASRRPQKSTVRGERKIKEDKWHTTLLLEPSVMEVWFGFPALDAENTNPSLTTMITTSLSKLCGFASRATSNGTKN